MLSFLSPLLVYEGYAQILFIFEKLHKVYIFSATICIPFKEEIT